VKKITRSLTGNLVTPRSRPNKERKEDLPRKPIEIATIGAIGFHRHLYKKGTEVFVTSLAEIERLIDEKDNRYQETREIKANIPRCYHKITETFSRIESDTLPPLRGAPDHKIELEDGKSLQELGYSPLYK
jgi:hypothetical protein